MLFSYSSLNRYTCSSYFFEIQPSTSTVLYGSVMYKLIQHFNIPFSTFVLLMQFIDGRLDLLNSGEGFNDIFEEEINMGEYAGEPPIMPYKNDFFLMTRMMINYI
ncbi:hypothetical protein ATANTOWER_005952 [Ataeniobius toweri]|uniref:Uncharacterized protein n=1 Tax=Ataeniobius toweri TaxID=208326 RepID=A0ABU7CEZ4_9TELE|nr:hypothetical protein [Ataeniobius toweri]